MTVPEEGYHLTDLRRRMPGALWWKLVVMPCGAHGSQVGVVRPFLVSSGAEAL